jgi:hypothetical protein
MGSRWRGRKRIVQSSEAEWSGYDAAGPFTFDI